MERKHFLKSILIGGLTMNTLSAFRKFTEGLGEEDVMMPVVFIGHGSPMNGIETNAFSHHWKKLATKIPVPKAVLVVSAHWLTRGTHITAMDFPRTIHDFGGFPRELFDVQYQAPGDALLAADIRSLIKSTDAGLDHDWGLDHGTWTVVRHMYPEANIPVLQLSIDYSKGPRYHYELAKELYALRKKGVLILGSGNMVHNLGMVAWDRLSEQSYGYDWALKINDQFKTAIIEGNDDALIEYEKFGKEALLAVPSPDHYLPLMYTLGLKGQKDEVSFFNDTAVGGSLTMTSVQFGV